MGANNKNLRKASKAKNDEFYTQLSDIEKELIHYKELFENKIIYCNCDNPSNSNFWNYFISNIKEFKIKGIISTYYSEDNISYKAELSNEDIADSKNIKDYIKRTQLKNNGDFRNEENIKILKSADIIITNPPFSLFREYIAQLVEYKKKFIIVGNNNSIACKGIFNLIKDNTIWLGYNSNKEMEFEIPDHYEKWNRIDKSTGKKYGKVPACSWFTNLKIKKREEWLELVKTYEGNEDKYPKYDNYDAINVDRVKDIPFDYKGNIGVPITFMTKFNPQQFEIIDGIHRYSILTGPTDKTKGKYLSMINNKAKFARIIIKQRESI